MSIELNLRAILPPASEPPRVWPRLRHLLRGASPAVAPGAWAQCRVDEAARRAWRDPVQFRREQLPAGSRARRVLDEAARRAGWSADAEPGTGRGIALAEKDGTWVAVVAVVDGARHVRQLVAAADAGPVIDFEMARDELTHGLHAGLEAAGYAADAAVIAVHWLVSDVRCATRERAAADAAAPAVVNAWHALQSTRSRGGAGEWPHG